MSADSNPDSRSRNSAFHAEDLEKLELYKYFLALVYFARLPEVVKHV